MKNYINTRLETTKHTKTINDIKHNLRKKKSRNQKNDNINFHFSPKGKKLNNQDMLNILEEYKQDREIHSQQFQELSNTNTKIRDRNSTWMSGLFTFSEAVEVKMGTQEEIENKVEKSYTYTDIKTKKEITIKGVPEYTIEDMRETALAAANDLAKHLGVSLKYISEHNDEERIHYQYHFENFKIGQKNTVFFEHRETKELSAIQDLGHKHFSKLGMDRGIKKEINTPNYQTTKAYYENLIKEQQQEIQVLKNNHENLISENLKQIEINKQLISNSTMRKKEVSKLDLSRKEKQIELKKITAETNALKQSNKDLLSENKVIKKIQKEEEERIDEKSLELDNKATEIIELKDIVEDTVDGLEEKHDKLIEEVEKLEEIKSDLQQDITLDSSKIEISISETEKEEIQLKNRVSELQEKEKTINKSINTKEEEESNIEKSIAKLKEDREKLSKNDMEETIPISIDKILDNKNYQTYMKDLKKDKIRPDLIDAMRKVSKVDIYDNNLLEMKKDFQDKLDKVIIERDRRFREDKTKMGDLTTENTTLKGTIKELETNIEDKIKIAVDTNTSQLIKEHNKNILNIKNEYKIKELKTDNIIDNLEEDIKGKDREITKLNIIIKEVKEKSIKKFNRFSNKVRKLFNGVKEVLQGHEKYREKMKGFPDKYTTMEEKVFDLEDRIEVAKTIYPDIEEKIEEHYDKKLDENMSGLDGWRESKEEEIVVEKIDLEKYNEGLNTKTTTYMDRKGRMKTKIKEIEDIEIEQ